MHNDMAELKQVAALFQWSADVRRVSRCGNGLINDTYLVTTDGGDYILQRINTEVFQSPWDVINNIGIVLRHIENKNIDSGHRQPLRLPSLIPARNGDICVVDDRQCYWRAMTFIGPSRTLDVVANATQAHEIGAALGYFQYLISDLKTPLTDTLPGFHVATRYLEEYDEVMRSGGSNPLVTFCAQMIEAHRACFPRLEQAKSAGELRSSVIHGDPKTNNFLFDMDRDEVVSIIDLDTVKPGLLHYDIGDCMRSACNPAGETAADIRDIKFDVTICEQVLKGYLPQVRPIFREADYDYLFTAVQLLPLELGVRFFNDYLRGNRYFKVDYAEQNLHRAAVQFQLSGDIARKEKTIRELIAKHR